MKKNIYLVVLFSVIILFTFACKENSLDGQVKLMSFETKETVLKENNNKGEPTDYQYEIITTSQDNIELKIEVYNPNDYYMMDYKLISNNPNLEILVGDVYEKLDNITSIRWNGVTNKETFLTLRLNSTEDTYLELDYIYFTDKHNGQEKYLTDLTNKNEFKIYKVAPIEFKVKGYAEGKYMVDIISDARVILNDVIDNLIYSETKDITVNYTYNFNEFSLESTVNYIIDDDELLEVYYHTVGEYDSIHILSHTFEDISKLKIELYETKEDYDNGILPVDTLFGGGEDLINGKVGHFIHGYDLSYKYMVFAIDGYVRHIQVIAQ